MKNRHNSLLNGTNSDAGFLSSLLDRAARSKLLLLLGAGCLLNAAALAYPTHNVTINVNASSPGGAVNPYFIGTAIGFQYINGDGYSDQVFVAGNTQLVNLYKAIGIKHIRIIKGSALNSPEPTAAQIDAFFGFCTVAGVTKVIWSLPLRNADRETGGWTYRDVARHIWATPSEKALVESFALDNEPDAAGFNGVDPDITDYNSYLTKWKSIASIVASDCPGCAFSGPDTFCLNCDGKCTTGMSGGVPWVKRFATAVTGAGYNLINANQHCYIADPGTLDEAGWANAILNNDWNTGFFVDIDNTLHSGLSVPLRYTEAMFFAGGDNQVNHIFATALAFLDFHHFQARHTVQGIDAMSNPFQMNAVIYGKRGVPFSAMPMAYAQKLFNMGTQGGSVIYASKFVITPSTEPMSAYGVVKGSHLYVTIINKSFYDSTSNDGIVLKTVINLQNFTAHNVSVSVLEAGVGASNAEGYSADISGGLLSPDGSPFTPTPLIRTVTGNTYTATVNPATAALYDFF